eukprot:TRINITY_DN30709_c0_g1_i1.p1 TRINITY_DN30709_c0_g1~~TRINITY_DN30709_c0_g1_i1.p1  ORF type:complete len:193 (-),score=35.10 TRINITY_DN30709_c0_g1_i1:23-562(-)
MAEQESTKPQDDYATVHHWECNKEFHTKEEVEKSMQEYPWKVVEPYDGKDWVTWDNLGLKVSDDKYNLTWRYCADLSLGWTGLFSIKPGKVEPMHHHEPAIVYYILQGEPIIIVNYIKNRATKWQCINIPSYCPHGIINDKDVETVIAWAYLPSDEGAKLTPRRNYNWKFLEDITGEEK